MYDVDREVDASQGTWDKVQYPGNYTHCLKTKYELVYDIIRNLGDKFAPLKECAKKEIAKIYYDPVEIKDIPELQKHLYEKLEAKSIADMYRKDMIHVGKRIPTQVATLKERRWPKEDVAKFNKLWKKNCPPYPEERANSQKVIDYIKKLEVEKKELKHGCCHQQRLPELHKE